MSRAVILVRHALPAVEPGRASTGWLLSEAGREDCVLLAHALPAKLAPVVLTSGEPKAHETATIVALRRGLDVQVDAGVAEVDRPAAWFDDYRSIAARYLASGHEPGWEPPESVVHRFQSAIERALELASGGEGDLVVVNHGLALSLWLASVAPVDLVPFWQSLSFPDAWRWDPGSGSLDHLFPAGRPAED